MDWLILFSHYGSFYLPCQLSVTLRPNFQAIKIEIAFIRLLVSLILIWFIISKQRPTTLLNAVFKILVKVLATSLVLVARNLVGGELICTILKRSNHNNVHLMWYIIDAGGILINLDRSKVFNRVDHLYLAVVLVSGLYLGAGLLQCTMISVQWSEQMITS